MSTLEKDGCAPLEAPLDALGEAALGDEELEEEELGDEELGEAALGDDELDAPPEALPEDEDLLSVALGLELDDEELGEAALGDDELDAPPEALPEGEDLLSVALGLELDEAPPLVLCAWATPPSASSAAAVATPTTFKNMVNFLLGDWGTCSAR